MMETTTIVSIDTLSCVPDGTVYELRWDPKHRTIEIKFTDKFYEEKRKKTIVIVDGEDMSMYEADILYMQDFIKRAITGKLDDSSVLNS